MSIERLRHMYSTLSKHKGYAANAARAMISVAGTKGVSMAAKRIAFYRVTMAKQGTQDYINGLSAIEDAPEGFEQSMYYSPEDFAAMLRGYALADALLTLLEFEPVTCDGTGGCSCDGCMIAAHLKGTE